MRMLALVTLTLPAEVLEREMLPVVPQGTVTMVAALSDSSWPVAPTVDADSEPDDRSAGEQRHRDGDVGAGRDGDIGIVLHQVDAGTGKGEGGCTGGVLDAVAAGEPVGGEQDRVVGGDGLLGLVDGA